MSKKTPAWKFSGDMSREEHLMNRVLFTEWVNRHNAKAQPKEKQQKAGKARKDTKNTLTKLLKDIYSAFEPESFDEFLAYLKDDNKTVIKVDEVNEILTYEIKDGSHTTATFKTLRNNYSKLKNTPR